MHVWAHARGDSRSTPGVSFDLSKLYFLRQDFRVNLELTLSAKLTNQEVPGIHLSLSTFPALWALGIETQVLILEQETLH